jgi:adenine/guanine phosphoribosyltransferase-like PRPP-binding protein
MTTRAEMRREIEAMADRDDLILDAIAHLSEAEAVSAVIGAIAARFDGASFDKIVADLVSLQEYMACADKPYGNA